MSTSLKEFFMDLSINGFFDDKLNLGADAMLSNKDISKYQLSPIDRNIYIYVKNIGSYTDIVLGEKYNVIYRRDDPKNYQKTDCEIDFVSLKKNDNIGIIPRRHGGCVRLKFKVKVPEMVKFLKQDNDEKFDKEKHQFIYFTTQEVMDSILEKLDKQENSSV
jgi:hypothetical protein